MSADVSPENERYIQTAIQNGQYRDRGQALDEALELLKQRDRLRREVNAGIEQLERGEGIPGEDVFERLRAKAEAISHPNDPLNP